MDTKSVGDTAEAFVLAALLKSGKKVLIPFGENHRYDLVTEDDGTFVRIQVKNGRLRNGSVIFSTSSSHYHRGGTTQSYTGSADVFGVYCPDTGRVYLVPVNDVGVSKTHLRVEPCNQVTGMRYAADYALPQ